MSNILSIKTKEGEIVFKKDFISIGEKMKLSLVNKLTREGYSFNRHDGLIHHFNQDYIVFGVIKILIEEGYNF